MAMNFDWLLRSSDYNPQIIGRLEGATSVNIQLWDITDGQNADVFIASSVCYQIGNTGRWGWSTAGLPTVQRHARHYFYLMTSNAAETFDGQFLMDVPEGAKWIHPTDSGNYLRTM